MRNTNQQAICLKQQLEDQAGTKLHLKINDNRSTMLSVKWEADITRVSLHRMFLQAPQNIMQELGYYLRKKQKSISPIIKSFIEQHLQNLDYSHELDLSKLDAIGKVYNLKQFYQQLNQTYFNNQLDLYVTWFGCGKKKPCKRLTFGLYHDPLRLIKINRLMDNERFPEYVIAFVIYHEMLHAVYPAYVDEKGMRRIHTPEFKLAEKRYQFYSLAQAWIKDHHHYLFNENSH